MKKNNKGFSLVELIVVVLIMAIIATALTLAVTKYVAKSKRSSDANTAGELKTAAETTVTDYLTSKDNLEGTSDTGCTITISGPTTGAGAWDYDSSGVNGYVEADFKEIFESAAGTTAPASKVYPKDSFKITITVDTKSQCKYEVNYATPSHSTDIFAAATK